MKRSLSFALLALAVAGCSDSDDDSGRFSLAVTDAPVDDAEAVVVTFTGAELLGGDEEQVFDLGSVAVDLLAMQGEQSTFLVEGVAIPPGEYEEIRLTVDAPAQSCTNPAGEPASYVTVDGAQYPLTVPSGSSSGFKVKGPLTIAAGGQTAYTVDFDLRQSIAERGATGCHNLRPVLRLVDNAQVGTLTGTVDGALLVDDSCSADPESGDGAAVYVFEGAGAAPDDVDGVEPEPLTSALLEQVIDEGSGQPTGDFTYTVGFLLAGDYTAALSCNAGMDDPEQDDTAVDFLQSQDAAISAEQTTQANFAAAG